jgi:hypothetical protein
MISRLVKTVTLTAFFALSGAAYAQSPASGGPNDPADPRGPVATDPAENGPASANPTDRGGGPAVKRSQERGEVPSEPRPRRQMDE